MKFYKYFNFNKNSLEQLLKRKLWMSGIDSFNDAFEFKYNIDIDFVNRLDLEGNIEGKYTGAEYSAVLREELLNNGVCCLSKNKPDEAMLMWSHYTNGHTGFALEVEIKEVNDDIIREVNYEDSVLKITAETIRDNKTIEGDILKRKSTDWQYENEWRIIVKKKNALYGSSKIVFSNITFGAKMKEKDKETIRSIMGNLVNYSQAKLSETEYKINITPC